MDGEHDLRPGDEVEGPGLVKAVAGDMEPPVPPGPGAEKRIPGKQVPCDLPSNLGGETLDPAAVGRQDHPSWIPDDAADIEITALDLAPGKFFKIPIDMLPASPGNCLKRP
jgi:hypothetical protein